MAQALLTAVCRGDAQTLRALIRDLALSDPRGAEHLSILAEEFDYLGLRALLEGSGTHEN